MFSAFSGVSFPSNFGLQGSIVEYGLVEAEMKRILKREYTAEFREQAVAMVNNGRSVPQVAEQLGLIAQTLRNWVKAAERGRLNEKARKVSEEQMELSRLRAENAQLKMENEILKKATAYFAKDRL
jgi:transposase